MKKFWMTAAAVAIAIVTLCQFPNIILAQNISQIYVFGDSLSDVGNVYQATNKESPPSPPYFQGRYSNGPVWVEYLAPKLNLTFNPNHNFAYGGAKTGDSKTLPPGVLAQIETFKATNQNRDRNALYIIWAGTNDYLGGATNTTVPVNNLTLAVQSLAAIGAKNILVVNLPDLGKLPGTRTTQRSQILNNLTNKHNAELAVSLNRLSQQINRDIDITYLDVNELFNQVVKSPEKFGFSNVTQACLNQGIVCNNPDRYLFWDSIHPSTAAHKLLVDLAGKKIKIYAIKSQNMANSGFKLVIIFGLFILSFLGFVFVFFMKRKKTMPKS